MPQFTYNLRSISNGDNGQFQDLVSSGQVVSNKTGAATSTTQGPNRFAGGLAVNNTSVMKGVLTTQPSFFTIPNTISRTATTGAGLVISATGGTTLTTAALLPNNGTILRTGVTTDAAFTDTLPSTSSIITAVAAQMPGGDWPVGTGYMLMYVNNQTTANKTWTIQRADTDTVFRNSGATLLVVPATSSSLSNFRLIYVIRLTSTQILIHEI
jgi:hypothetical protein